MNHEAPPSTPKLVAEDLTRSDLPTTFLTSPNLLSLSRVALTFPFVLAMQSELPSGRWWAAGIMVAAALTDKFDGLLARSFHHTSEWGKILDPIADKIAATVVMAVLLLRQEIPPWFVATVVARDSVILLGGLYLRMRYHVLLPSNEMGKWTFALIGCVLFLIVLGIEPAIMQPLLFVSALAMFISLWAYGKRAAGILRKGA